MYRLASFVSPGLHRLVSTGIKKRLSSFRSETIVWYLQTETQKYVVYFRTSVPPLFNSPIGEKFERCPYRFLPSSHTHTRTYAHTHTYTKQMRAVSVQWASFYSLSRIQYKIQACCASAVGFCWIDALNFNSALAWPLTPPYGPSGDFAGVDWGAASTLASAPRPGHPLTVPLWCFLFALSM